MNNHKHTPGPWEATKLAQGSWLVYVYDDATQPIALLSPAKGPDARLIAAAPELLEALEEIASLTPEAAPTGNVVVIGDLVGVTLTITDAVVIVNAEGVVQDADYSSVMAAFKRQRPVKLHDGSYVYETYYEDVDVTEHVGTATVHGWLYYEYAKGNTSNMRVETIVEDDE